MAHNQPQFRHVWTEDNEEYLLDVLRTMNMAIPLRPIVPIDDPWERMATERELDNFWVDVEMRLNWRFGGKFTKQEIAQQFGEIRQRYETFRAFLQEPGFQWLRDRNITRAEPAGLWLQFPQYGYYRWEGEKHWDKISALFVEDFVPAPRVWLHEVVEEPNQGVIEDEGMENLDDVAPNEDFEEDDVILADYEHDQWDDDEEEEDQEDQDDHDDEGGN